MSRIWWIVGVFAVVAGVCSGPCVRWVSPVDPVYYELPPLQELEKNGFLEDAEHMFRGQLKGPESFTQDEDGFFYTGVGDGRIVRFKWDDQEVETFARTGVAHPKCGVRAWEHKCGRPLGLTYDSAKRRLLVADAYLGVVSIDKETREVTRLTPDLEVHFLNGISVSSVGTIFFSDSSSKFGRRDFLLTGLESRPDGKLYALHENGSLEVLQDSLTFPNGIACFPASDDCSEILIAETVGSKIRRYDLKSRSLSVFSEDLPASVDNIQISNIGGRRRLFVGSGFTRKRPFSMAQFLGPRPFLRRILSLVPYSIGSMALPREGVILELDPVTGELVQVFLDLTGRTAHISEGYGVEIGGRPFLLVGSYANDFIGRLPL